jgi:hypothetical protein
LFAEATLLGLPLNSIPSDLILLLLLLETMGVACSKQDATVDGNNPHHNYYHDQQHLAQQNGGQASGGVWSGCMSSCSGIDPTVDPRMDSCRADAIDPVMYDLCRKSLNMTLQDEENKAKEESAPPQPSTQPKQKQRQPPHHVGQYHLLYKHQSKSSSNLTSTPTEAPEVSGVDDISTVPTTSPYSTRLIVRRRPIAATEEGTHGTHLYAIRYPPDDVVENKKVISGSNSDSNRLQEQCPTPSTRKEKKKRNDPATEPIPEPPRPSPAPPSPLPTEGLTDFFQPARMKQTKTSKQTSKCCENGIGKIAWVERTAAKRISFCPFLTSLELPMSQNNHRTLPNWICSRSPHFLIFLWNTVKEWVTVSEEHCIYVVDVGLSPAQCDKIVQVTEQVCRGQYAAYTYAKQTLGCREFPILAQACAPPVQSVVQAILGLPNSSAKGRPGCKDQPQQHLQLDDREPHLVKYDVTKKERQKLDMHTDKSEWTFLIALSNGCGLDYDGGGTYFECLNATIHIQRGHALIFPGKLRHCGQRITRGLRYLLVGFLVDKAHLATNTSSASTSKSAATAGKSSSNEDDNNNSGSALGTKPVSAKTLTGMPATVASA